MEDGSGMIAQLQKSLGQALGAEQLRLIKHSISILESIDRNENQPGDMLASLLNGVIKPLFASTPNPNLTSTGRKNLVALPPTNGRFNSTVSEAQKIPWKQSSWSIDLLKYIVTQYATFPNSAQRRIIDAQFYLLVPPILALIDDGDLSYKTGGCAILDTLCKSISVCGSTILRRTGLVDVFAESLRTNFMLLPTLTPEDESLALLQQLYPAFRALVIATYPPTTTSASPATTTLPPTSIPATNSTKTPNNSTQRQKLLDTILRHGILASYTHCSTSHIRMATFLIEQTALTVPLMQLNATKYLPTLVPLVRGILTDPLGAAYPPLLAAGLALLQCLLVHCPARVASTWWAECLRACVGCWLVVRTDLPGPKGSRLTQQMRQTVEVLAGMVGGRKFDEVAETLVKEDEDLRSLLFDV